MTALRKVFISVAGRRLFLLLLVSCFSFSVSRAQITIPVGAANGANGETDYPCPLQDYFESSRMQFLYLASELKAAGMDSGFIKSISYKVTGGILPGTFAPMEGLSIKIGGSTVGTLDIYSWETVANQVYGPVDYKAVLGINTFVFSTPFLWNGRDNLIIEICNGIDDNKSPTDYSTVNPSVTWTTNLPFYACHTTLAQNSGSLCGTAETGTTGDLNTRPDITFGWSPAVVCAGTPVAGAVTASVTTTCGTAPFDLTLSGATIADNITYQWQSSVNGVNWNNMTASGGFGVTTSQSVTTSYRVLATCGVSGASATSTPVEVVTPPAVSGIYTINKDQATGGGNFQSFNDAYNFIKCGINGNVVFNVTSVSGSYNEQLLMQSVPGASASNTVTFNGNGQLIEYLATDGGQRAVIELNGASHIRFNNLRITATGQAWGQYGWAVHLMNNADSNTISNCVITVDSTSGMDSYVGIMINGSSYSFMGSNTSGCDSNSIRNNIITGGYTGIAVISNSDLANMRNSITGNTIREFYQYGMYISYTYATLIANNRFTRENNPFNSYEMAGIYASGLSSKMVIDANVITHMGGATIDYSGSLYGIYLYSVNTLAGLNNLVSNNKIYNLGEAGTAYGIYNMGSGNLLYAHNAISLDGDGSASFSVPVMRGFYIDAGEPDIVLKNNMVTVTRTGPGNKACIEIQGDVSKVTANRNNYYIPNSIGGKINTGFVNGNYSNTLKDWQTATGGDAESFSLNPSYEDILAGNLKPLNAAVDNRGEYSSLVPADIDGVFRSTTTPDVGVYEYTPPPCIAPPTAGAVKPASDTVCVNAQVGMGLSGYSNGSGQTYQWQYAASLADAFVNLGAALNSADTVIRPSATSYYRVQVGCGASYAYTNPVRVVTKNSLPAGNYTLSNTAAVGTVDFNSFTQAASALACGIQGSVVVDVVSVNSVYNEQLILGEVPGTSVSNLLTFNGNGNTLTYGATNTEEKAILKLNGTDHVIVDSLIIQPNNSGMYGYGIQLLNNADSNLFRKCTVDIPMELWWSEFNGVVINATNDDATATGASLCDGNVFENNTIKGGYTGISVVSNMDNPVAGNQFINNQVQDFYARGIYLQNTVGAIVDHNSISRPVRSDVNYEFQGIQVLEKANKLVVNGNRIYNPFGGNTGSNGEVFGIGLILAAFDAGQEGLVSNNLLYNFNGSGNLYGIAFINTGNVKCYHNTISFDHVLNTAPTNAYGLYAMGTITGVDVQNNIVTVTRGGKGRKAAVFSYSPLQDARFDYNDYYVAGADGTNNIGDIDGVGSYATLAGWQAGVSQDAHSANIDPVYTAPATGNLKPAVMPMDNTGHYVQVATDVVGVSRSAVTPDMGAYEFTLPLCTAPPVAGVATAVPASGICMGSTIALDIQGNSAGGTQTYQWQQSKDGATGWVNAGKLQYLPAVAMQVMHSNWYRCAVACGGDTVYSAAVAVTLNDPLPGGVYTIATDGSGNYPSFNAAVAAMECGIGGAVTFLVKAGTYTENVKMHYVYGSSDTSRITFRAENGVASSVVLNSSATSPDDNYVVKLDSASYTTFSNISLQANSTFGLGTVAMITNTASADSLVNCVLTAPAANYFSLNTAVVLLDNAVGSNNVIKGNTIQNGSAGIYLNGSDFSWINTTVLDSNHIMGAKRYGLYGTYAHTPVINRNLVEQTAGLFESAYGIQLRFCDSGYQVKGNTVLLKNASGDVYGISVSNNRSSDNSAGYITGNRIEGLTGNAGSIRGVEVASTELSYVRNNVVSIASSGNYASTYGIYDENSGGRYYNNSVLNKSLAGYSNYAGMFMSDYDAYGTSMIYNNIFAQLGGGRALYLSQNQSVSSDYNMLYSTGTGIGIGDNGDAVTLPDWVAVSKRDEHSIVYKPAFADETTLLPALNDSAVWAMHGRGIQLQGNVDDFNGNARPVTLQEGVPDLGAYEFMPVMVPVVATANPAAPVADAAQVFTMGSDTVAVIHWGSSVPSLVKMRRYSGVLPPSLAAATPQMYFYTDAEVTGSVSDYQVEQFYIDPWLYNINAEQKVRLGKTDDTGAWGVDGKSKVFTGKNSILSDTLHYLARFTGIADTSIKENPDQYLATDSSNAGTRFWVAYGHNSNFSTYGDNSQEMVLYFSATQAAHVTVHVNGTNWTKEYDVPANTAISSDAIPKTGLDDARLLWEGKYSRGISIESNVPIVAYAHIYSFTSSGATMLLPEGTYGYEYYALTAPQYSADPGSYSWFTVVASHDNTAVEITPSCATVGGKVARQPFVVMLNKGEVYQVMGDLTGGDNYQGYEVTGSKIKSITNVDGKCYPIAVFSGNSRTFISCDYSISGASDNIIQQNFPMQAWGKRYLTVAVPKEEAFTSPMQHMCRVLVKDPATLVKRNGVVLTSLLNNSYYEFFSNTSDYIESDKAVMVAQYMLSDEACEPGQLMGDPEMVYVSPIEQGIHRVSFYRNTVENVKANYLLLTIPDKGVNSLLIDGSNTFSYSYPHPNLSGYTVVVQRWNAAKASVSVSSDSAFTAVTYGEGPNESYGYNAGTLVRNLSAWPGIVNKYDSSGTNSKYACVGTTFRFTVVAPLQPETIVWHFSQLPQLGVTVDSVQVMPVASDTVIVNGQAYYLYTVSKEFSFAQTGVYQLPVTYTSAAIESCDHSIHQLLTITVIEAPVVDFTATYSGCLNDVVQLEGSGAAGDGSAIQKWLWSFGDNQSGYSKDTTWQYTDAGTYQVKLTVIDAYGCMADTAKEVAALPFATLAIADTVWACKGAAVTLTLNSAETGIVYNWYDVETGGTPLVAAVSYTINNLAGTTDVYVEAVKNDCASPRKKVTAAVFADLLPPMVTVDTVGVNMVVFSWTPVTGAVTYEVSLDGGTTWIIPSSGTDGLTHVVTGLRASQEVSLLVRAKGNAVCEVTVSEKKTATTLPDKIFIPNAFSPNGDGLNDVIKIYGFGVKELTFAVFNQWGEKVFETRDQAQGWDGYWKGKPQPSGVYMYVCQVVLTDGSTQTKKGAINLVR
ncbi:gliding motility-associated C-terminal domain-containing protein [Filimonas lacunae]|uniref:Gliding motility-associated C-terminal domain-containing protein n=1 Tax=Filimonas lacunae TaxID=477680 RepID=A0A173M925_9BACT|nr:gliding motility-associated C-terminal domain-containing protein [Filimonas lacunae]BAV04035.1 CHU large protein [Filimonas lacunae]SIT16218.1 gliding motility-associated C-terminal domain-containing protein [Filimonas lacunae]